MKLQPGITTDYRFLVASTVNGSSRTRVGGNRSVISEAVDQLSRVRYPYEHTFPLDTGLGEIGPAYPVSTNKHDG